MGRLALPEGNVIPQTSAYLDALSEARKLIDVMPAEFVTMPSSRPSTKALATAALGVGLSIAPVGNSFVGRSPRAYAETPVDPGLTIVIEGDSLTDGRVNYGDMIQAFTDAGVTVLAIDYKSGRPLINPACDTNPDSANCRKLGDGPTSIAQMNDAIVGADGFLLGLSTNDRLANERNNLIRNVRDVNARGLQDGKPILIITPEVFGDAKRIHADEKNAIQHQVEAEMQAESIDMVVPAYREPARNSVTLSADQIHPAGKKGYTELVALDVATVVPLLRAHHAEIYGTPTTDIQPAPATLPVVEPVPVLPKNQPLPEIIPAAPVKTAKEVSFLLDMSGLVSQNPVLELPNTNTPALAPSRFQRLVYDIGTLPGPKTADTAPVADSYQPGPQAVPLQLINIEPIAPTADGSPQAYELPPIDQEATPLLEIIPALPEPAAGAPSSVAAPEASAPVIEVPQPSPESVPDFSSMYSIGEDGVVHAEELKNFLMNGGGGFKKAKAGDGLPNGLYLAPKSMDGLYSFVDGVTDRGRLTSIEGAVYLIISAEKVKEMLPRYPGLTPLQISVILDSHIEHLNAADLDQLLLNDPEARQEFFLWKLSLRDPERTGNDGAYIHHIVTGDNSLKAAGNAYLAQQGYSRPKILLQTDHGVEPEGGNHTHDSLDGDGKNGPYFVDAANIPYHDTRPVALEDGNSSDIPSAAVIEPILPPAPAAKILINILPIPDVVPELPRIDQGTNNSVKNKKNNAKNPPANAGVVINGSQDTTGSANGNTNGNQADPSADSNAQPPADTTAPGTPEAPPTEPAPADVPADPAPVAEIPAVTVPDITYGSAIVPHEGLVGDTIPDQMRNFFLAQGYTEAGVEGIMANAAAEGGLKDDRMQNTYKGVCAPPPERLNPRLSKEKGGTKGIGVNPWQLTDEGYQDALQALADDMGLPWHDRLVGYTYMAKIVDAKPALKEILTTSNNYAETTEAVLMKFERPKAVLPPRDPTPVINDRVAIAAQFHEAISSGQVSSIDVACDGVGPS